ncbi:MAG TPA: hypothetical protein VD866_28470 [Urbifossiella sp.]|nr:hypothetical protein [Urbifossiella sp.]
MTDHPTHTTGETLTQMLEGTIFADPVTHRIRGEWEETKREVQALFDKACTEEYERRLGYYRTCAEPDAEARARRAAALIRPLLAEEREQRLALVWARVLQRVEAVLADKAAEAEDSGSGGSTGDTTGR